MTPVVQTTPQSPFTRLFPSLQTGSSITAPSATATEPSGAGIFEPPPQSSNAVLLCFFGDNAADETFTARVTGWRKSGDLWIPVPLLAISGILGAMTGVAGKDVSNAHLFADALTISTAFTTAYEVINPGGDQVAEIKLDTFGCKKIQVQVAKGTCDGVNVLASSF